MNTVSERITDDSQIELSAFDRFLRGPTAKPVIYRPLLTEILQETLLLVEQGLSKTEIAAKLGISYAAANSRVAKLKELGYSV